jgi:uncharacterized protein (TIGR00290 family)
MRGPADPEDRTTVTAARTWVSWSTGKDSTLALLRARQDPALEVTGLLTTLNGAADRVAMHAVRRELLEAQAERLGLALHAVDLPWPCSNEDYEQRMGAAVASAVAEGVERVVFGDLHLEDIRAYREGLLQGTGLTAEFPLWGEPTDRLARTMLDAGVRAVLTCVDPARVPAQLVGRPWDEQLLADLPAGADPCGENGEFHTFVWDGPGFAAPIPIELGEVVERGGFVYRDVLPAG